MTTQLEFLQVRGDKITDPRGDEVRLRGFCLGSWLNLEAFMIGFPGTETAFRKAVASILGETKGGYFFDRLLHYFAAQADFDYISSLGCNLVRVAFNYRHFEEDRSPFEYKPGGFEWLDKAIAWGRKAGVYLSLDFHAFPGWQSRGWHCDNPGGPPQFWEHPHFQERAVALWVEIARRYKDDPAVAMYGIMNEPEAHDAAVLNRYYKQVTEAIRTVDSHHILNFEGNFYSTDFSQLEPPSDPNVVYSSHLYVNAGLDDIHYPGSVGGVHFDRAAIDEIYQQRRAYCAEHGIPHYISEFGPIYNDPAYLDSKLRVMADFLEIIESYGDHWTIWNYKDIGKMGIVSVDPNSTWMDRIRPVHRVKTKLRCDSWVDRASAGLDPHLQDLQDYIQSQVGVLPGNWDGIKEQFGYALGDRMLAPMLLPAFTEQFRGMTEAEIDALMASFAFENCRPRQGLAAVIHRYTGGKSNKIDR